MPSQSFQNGQTLGQLFEPLYNSNTPPQTLWRPRHSVKCLTLHNGSTFVKMSVHNHVSGGAIDQAKHTVFHNPVYKMVMHINVLCVGVKLVVIRECDGQLVVGEQSYCVIEWAEDLCQHVVKPYALLHVMGGCDCCAALAQLTGMVLTLLGE